jgi:hypothetical protein
MRFNAILVAAAGLLALAGASVTGPAGASLSPHDEGIHNSEPAVYAGLDLSDNDGSDDEPSSRPTLVLVAVPLAVLVMAVATLSRSASRCATPGRLRTAIATAIAYSLTTRRSVVGTWVNFR